MFFLSTRTVLVCYRDSMESAGAITAAIVDLDGELNETAGHLNAQHARLVDLCVTMLADRSAWAGPGVERPELYLAWKVGLSTARAKQIVEIAERAREMPVTIEAFRRGELAIDQVVAVVRRAPWWADRDVCELARNATVHQLRTALGTYPFPDIANPANPDNPSHPDDTHNADTGVETASSTVEPNDTTASEPTPPAAPPAPPAPKDTLWFGIGDDGRFRLNLECDELTGMIITNALRESRDRLFHHDHPDLDWTDALRDIAERSLDAVGDLARRDRYRIHIHLNTDGTTSDDHGRRLPDAIARHIGCDALVTPTFIHDTIPISIGRTGRTIPERTRRLVILRDQSCRVPGCTQTHILEVHHIIHWHHGGPTDTWNLIALCPHHHRMHHQGQLGITGNADTDTVVFTDTNSNPLKPTGARPQPPGAPPPPPRGTYQHPLGERLDTHWLHFNPPPQHTPRQPPEHRHPTRRHTA